MKNEYRHIPVLLNEVIDSFSNFQRPHNNSLVFIDCTLGGAGHSSRIVEKMQNNDIYIGIDQDQDAISAASKLLSKFDGPEIRLFNNNFGNLDEVLLEANVVGIDGVLFDLGLSSYQIDTRDRGFSFKEDCILDMRMNANSKVSAATIVNSYSRQDLAKIFKEYGEEKYSDSIAFQICKHREQAEIKFSSELVEIIKKSIPASARRQGGHPAKRVFQALRIEVNNELGVLKEGLDAALRWLNPGGVISVISYHSLEDKIVKEQFSHLANRCVCPPDLPICMCNKKPIIKIITKHPIQPSLDEVNNNARSRSAKLRIAVKQYKGIAKDANNETVK